MADIYKFCEEIILGPGGLHSFEYHEVATPNVHRDVAVACWVIRCLANAKKPEAQAIIYEIIKRRSEATLNA